MKKENENIGELKKELVTKNEYGFDDLVKIMVVLRSEEGCPWDREQTHESIRNDFIEETYEVIEAIDTADPVLLREELGDVMLQIIFHSRISEENGGFDIRDVCRDICKKLYNQRVRDDNKKRFRCNLWISGSRSKRP